jgi:hypothetical protein
LAHCCAPIPVCVPCKRLEGATRKFPGFSRLELTVERSEFVQVPKVYEQNRKKYPCAPIPVCGLCKRPEGAHVTEAETGPPPRPPTLEQQPERDCFTWNIRPKRGECLFSDISASFAGGRRNTSYTLFSCGKSKNTGRIFIENMGIRWRTVHKPPCALAFHPQSSRANLCSSPLWIGTGRRLLRAFCLRTVPFVILY